VICSIDRSIDQGQILVDDTAEIIYRFNGSTRKHLRIFGGEMMDQSSRCSKFNASLLAKIVVFVYQTTNVYVLSGIRERPVTHVMYRLPTFHSRRSLSLFSLESSGFCSNPAGGTMSLNTFGSGSSQFSSGTPTNWSFTTTCVQRFTTNINDGQFGVLNAVPTFYYWLTGGIDNTVNDTNGYMMLFNLAGSWSPMYIQRIGQ
jgi:hypothetical protein